MFPSEALAKRPIINVIMGSEAQLNEQVSDERTSGQSLSF